MRLSAVALLCCTLCAHESLKFEVASVKMRPPNCLISVVGGSPKGPRLILEAMSLADLISWAWDVKPWEMIGGPAWAGVYKDRSSLGSADRRFDISARAEGESPRSTDEFRRMLQALLTERFLLTLHRESRETAVYALVPDKNGTRLTESGPEAKGFLMMKRGGFIQGAGATMTQLVSWFSNANGLDRPVLDQTGLTGKYDFSLEWSNPLAAPSDSTTPSIFTAMVEQLGLRLEPRRAPVKFLVIDKAEMPSEN